MDGATLYILRCADGKLYTGLTRRDVDERVSEHAKASPRSRALQTSGRADLLRALRLHNRRDRCRAPHQRLVARQEARLHRRRFRAAVRAAAFGKITARASVQAPGEAEGCKRKMR